MDRFGRYQDSIKAILILSMILFLGGCARAKQYVPFPDQTVTVTDPSKGRVYLIRPTRFGAAVPMDISDEGQSIGRTYGHSYLSWERNPGTVTIEGKAENTEKLQVLLKKGRRLYIKQSVEMGVLMARNSLAPIDEQTAQEYLENLKPPKQK